MAKCIKSCGDIMSYRLTADDCRNLATDDIRHGQNSKTKLYTVPFLRLPQSFVFKSTVHGFGDQVSVVLISAICCITAHNASVHGLCCGFVVGNRVEHNTYITVA